MKSRPILFSAPMVRALLDGRKTQTRRVVKPQPTQERDGMWGHESLSGLFAEHVFGPCMATLSPCPYGAPGDRLWVKEAIRRVGQDYGGPIEREVSEFVADGARTKADAWPWKRDTLPGMFLPKGLCRLALEVTAVRLERLQDISEEDAKAEGVRDFFEEYDCIGREQRLPSGTVCAETPFRASFEMLWESINGAESWAANPWVWVVEFRRLE